MRSAQVNPHLLFFVPVLIVALMGLLTLTQTTQTGQLIEGGKLSPGTGISPGKGPPIRNPELGVGVGDLGIPRERITPERLPGDVGMPGKGKKYRGAPELPPWLEGGGTTPPKEKPKEGAEGDSDQPPVEDVEDKKGKKKKKKPGHCNCEGYVKYKITNCKFKDSQDPNPQAPPKPGMIQCAFPPESMNPGTGPSPTYTPVSKELEDDCATHEECQFPCKKYFLNSNNFPKPKEIPKGTTSLPGCKFPIPPGGPIDTCKDGNLANVVIVPEKNFYKCIKNK